MTEKKLPHDHGRLAHIRPEDIPDTEVFLPASDLFKLLGDGSRMRIFWLLCHCELCVINLSALVEMSSPAVSHHLRQLKNGGLIQSRREGKEVYYRAAGTEQVRLLHQSIEQLLGKECPEARCLKKEEA